MSKIAKLTPELLKKIIAEEKLKIAEQLSSVKPKIKINNDKSVKRISEAQKRLIKKYKLLSVTKKILKHKMRSKK